MICIYPKGCRVRAWPDNADMSRYVFSSSTALDDKALEAAKKAARAHGAIVVRSLAGTMLLELSPEKVPQVSEALPGWRCTEDRKTTRVPERRPLERAKARAISSTGAKA
jgi:hypothetical protein